MHQGPIAEIVQDLVYTSYLRAADQAHGLDSATRDISLTHDLFTRLNIQWKQWPCVTIAGSKGKGSTAAFLASMLQASGERVGLVSSPEMRRFNERIRLNGGCISDKELEVAAHKIAPAVRQIVSQVTPPRYLGPGGVILAMAATIFMEKDVSVLVIEAGRGGSYDESRLVEGTVSVLTPIMLEHPDKLGATVQDIARTKAYITAPYSSIVTAPQLATVQAVIAEVAATLGSPVHSVYKDVLVENLRYHPHGVVCDIQIGEISYPDLHVSLAGLHQAENAATAILAAHTLAASIGVKCTSEGVYTGARRVRWPGRAQVLQHHPWVLVDGAINRESAKQICDLVRSYSARRVTAVVAVPKPKDLDGLCAEVAQVADKIVLTEVAVPTLIWYEDALRIASRYSSNVQFIAPAENAFASILHQVQPDEGIVLLGTQSFVGSVLHYWDVDTCTIW